MGLVLLFLNPPSLSGAEGMALLVGGGLALLLGTAWATVALTGRDSMPEHEFERLVRRSEELAATPSLRSEAGEFDLLVAEAIDELPRSSSASWTPHQWWSPIAGPSTAPTATTWDTVARDNYPDRIVLYQDTLERDFGYDPELLRAQVVRTLRHELAHHLGWNEPGVRELGL